MARRASGHGTSPEVHVLESHGLQAMYFKPMNFRLWTLNLLTSELGTSEYGRFSNQLEMLTSTSQQFDHFANFDGDECHVLGSLVTPVIVSYIYLRSNVK